MKLKIILLIALVVCCCGCTCTQLSMGDFERNLPKGIVTQYEAGSGYFVDEGETFLPFLFQANSYVSKSKQQFSAYNDMNVAVGAYDFFQFSTFDKEGKLLEHYRSRSILTPLVYRSSSSTVNSNKITQKGFSWSLVSFGYEKKVSGDKYLSALWIPIKIHEESSPKSALTFDPKIRKKAAQIALRNNKKQKESRH